MTMDLAKLRAQQATPVGQPNTPPAPAEILEPKPVEENMYQHYACARQSMKMITHGGKKIIFTGYKLITRDQDVIAYLDDEIRKGIRVVTKGELLSTEDSDPMASYRKQVIAEYEAKQAAEKMAAAVGDLPEVGTTEGATSLSPASSKNVANQS